MPFVVILKVQHLFQFIWLTEQVVVPMVEVLPAQPRPLQPNHLLPNQMVAVMVLVNIRAQTVVGDTHVMIQQDAATSETKEHDPPEAFSTGSFFSTVISQKLILDL